MANRAPARDSRLTETSRILAPLGPSGLIDQVAEVQRREETPLYRFDCSDRSIGSNSKSLAGRQRRAGGGR